MNKNRLEAFSDGVLAIIITIMVLEIKVPHGAEWRDWQPVIPVILSYVISFLLIGIYWGNHHHLMHVAKKVNSGILLSNLHLLFWLSLVPMATAWMGENHFEPNTIILYSSLMLVCGLSYSIFQHQILQTVETVSGDDKLAVAIRKQNTKVLMSFLADLLAIPFAYVHPAISGVLLLLQSVIWLIPDRNIEKALAD